MNKVLSQTLGYPRIGRRRELKRALEGFWGGKLGDGELLQAWHEVEAEGWRVQQAAGLDRIGVGDSSLYDPVLDWAIRFGAIPERHRGRTGWDLLFGMARGAGDAAALELTKWFDTNYHYLVPEIDSRWEPVPEFTDYLSTLGRAAEVLEGCAVPIVLGPVTFLRLSRTDLSIQEGLRRILPAYRELLQEIRDLRRGAWGVPEVQLHEPALVLPHSAEDRPLYEMAYGELTSLIPLQLVTYFDDLGESFSWASRLPVPSIALDFTRGDNRSLLRKHGWPKETTLSAGLIDGRSVWRFDPERTLPLAEEIRQHAPLRVSPSSSLQFVPHSVQAEAGLPDFLAGVLAFADEKLLEVTQLAAYLNGEQATSIFEAGASAWAGYRAVIPAQTDLAQRIGALNSNDFARTTDYVGRRPTQIQLPAFPTTTIGSFPQTREIRSLRRQRKEGVLGESEYQAGIDQAIRETVRAQDEIGLDVLVHGEFERTDMVEYFAERLHGFAITEHGWVQSYGSRCVRPPIIYGDIDRPAALTVREFIVAQSATSRPVKGMLTGPVTILNWSFPRADIPRREIAFQIALALRSEIRDLEVAGARLVQVDEPALREGLPLRPERRAEYLAWAVDAFRLATGGARPETQIHTHMCYGDFGDVIEAIDRMDADVISLENARSGDETLEELARFGYRRQVGPGVYDVHSPAVLSLEAAMGKLRSFHRHLPPDQIWVNPDCGLKTRDWPEVLASLRNLVAAARQVREEV
ncbi:MAG: 5-methyltetrahydropteroyltriglutamate--homocysteine S-methyltransferase, partial [Anaerolineales bacterium]